MRSVVQIYLGPPAFQECARRFGELAQLGERLLCTQEVTGSIPVFSTNCEGKAESFRRNDSALSSELPAEALAQAGGSRFFDN